MNDSVALVVIYNHRHSANIEALENLYRARFSHIYHLMPFYEGGGGCNVIPVYESSAYFQGHLAQGYDQYFAKSHRHYLFIADDLVLNPMIHEGNYAEYFGLDGDAAKSFIHACEPLHEAADWPCVQWAGTWGDGLQKEELLPAYDEVLKRFENLGLTIKPIPAHLIRVPSEYQTTPLRWRNITDIDGAMRFAEHMKMKLWALYLKRRNRTYTPFLPFVYGYSDLCIVSSKHIRPFIHHCRIFAAGNLFVEIALPTALAMCAEPGEIVTAKDLSSGQMILWGSEKIERFAERYGRQLGRLMADWPEDALYVHPVKISQWSQ